MRCDQLQLEQLLSAANEEGPAIDLAASHLESCPACRRRLADLSDADALTNEACQTLRTQGEASGDSQNSRLSVVVAIESLMAADNPIECETVTLDFLETAGHPEMLGRLGRYDVERVVGTGGMGVVLKGFDTELHRVVAIKVLLPHLANSTAARRRFTREAQAAAAVVHEHVIPIYNVETDGPLPYLVMQFVPGDSLQTRVDVQGPLDVKDVLRIARQAAAGLAAAHAQGLVHRDVKPANILLAESVDRVLISDFGLARTVDDATLTRTGILAGTPHYMSPEQAHGDRVDPRSDLFSLGSVLYFMCTGRPPLRADSPMVVLNRICHNPHRSVDEVNADVPGELAELIDQLLAKDPADRCPTATEVETRCARLLAVLQQGGRLRRRRWPRFVTRHHVALKRTAIGMVAMIGCLVLFAWLANRNGVRVTDDTPTAASQQPMVVAKPVDPGPTPAPTPTPRPAAHLAVVPPTLPPDTFPQDLLETEQLLGALEHREHAPQPRSDMPIDQEWKTDLATTLSKLHQMEAPPKLDPPKLDPPKLDPPKLDPPKLDPPKLDSGAFTPADSQNLKREHE